MPLLSDETRNGLPCSSLVEERCHAVRWLKLITINLLAFGLELCASAGFTYIPPIMLKKGFSESALSVIVGIGPFISLLLVPAIGRWSDSCNSRFGRRRPFIFFLGLLILLSLVMIPFSEEIAVLSYGLFSGSVVLAIGVIGLDFSTQAIMNPCKALIPDIFKSTEEQNSAFTVYSVMLSTGGCVGYLISSINWADTELGVLFGGQEKAVFCFLTIIFLFLLLFNLTLAKEVPLIKANTGIDSGQDVLVEVPNHCTSESGILSFHSVMATHNLGLLKKIEDPSCSSYRRAVRPIFMSCFRHISCCLVPLKKLLFMLKSSFQRFMKMPPVLLHIFVSNLFGWMGIMCHDLYYTDFVGQVIYRGKPNAESESLNLYNQGVRMASWGLLLHCLSAALYSGLFHERFVSKFGLAYAYLSGTVLFTFCMIGTVLTESVILVNIYCALSGTGYSALTTVPYSLVTVYHSSKKKYYGSEEDRGIGEDMAVLDSAFYLSQIIPSFFLGFVVDIVGSSSVYMVIAALCGVLATYTAVYIRFPSIDTILF